MKFFLFTSKERNTTIFIYFVMPLAYILVFFKPISVSVRVNNFCLILFLYKEALDIYIKSSIVSFCILILCGVTRRTSTVRKKT